MHNKVENIIYIKKHKLELKNKKPFRNAWEAFWGVFSETFNAIQELLRNLHLGRRYKRKSRMLARSRKRKAHLHYRNVIKLMNKDKKQILVCVKHRLEAIRSESTLSVNTAYCFISFLLLAIGFNYAEESVGKYITKAVSNAIITSLFVIAQVFAIILALRILMHHGVIVGEYNKKKYIKHITHIKAIVGNKG